MSSSITDEVAELRGTRSATIKDLLTNRGFSRLLAAMVVSSFGDWLGFIAVTSIVAGIGGIGSAGVAVAGVMVARTLPAFVFGPIAGAFVDRLDRKQLMIASDIGRGVLYLSMAFLHQLWAIYLFSFVIECLSLLWTPARDASLPNLVPRRQLANANSLVVISSYATLPIGGIAFAALAGVSKGLGARVPVLGDSPAALALVVDAATFLFSAAMVFGIPLRTLRGDSTEKMDLSRVFRDARDGIRFLREDSIASAMTGGLVIAFAGIGAVLAIMPIFVQYTLRGESSGWGLVVTAFGVGLALGLAAAGQVARLIERDRVAVWSLCAAGIMLILLAAMPNLAWAVALSVWLGAFCGLAYVSGYTLLQENVVDEYRGRTFAALTTMSRMMLFISLIVFPTLAAIFGSIAVRLGINELFIGGQSDRPVRHPARLVVRRRAARGRLVQHASAADAVPFDPSRPPHDRAETQATARHRLVHRLRRSRGRWQGHPDRAAGAVPARRGRVGDGHARARRHPRGGADPRPAPGSGDGRTRRADRGVVVRRGACPDRGDRDPARAGRGQGGDLRSLRRLLARLSRAPVGDSARPMCCR